MSPSPPPVGLWIKVPKPTFDLVGVVLSSLALAGFVALLGLALGLLMGLVLLKRPKKERPRLDLSDRPPADGAP